MPNGKWAVPLGLAIGLVLMLGGTATSPWARSALTLRAQNTTTAVSTPSSRGSTYYVRTDGGSPTQCTGLVDAPYPGSGTNQPCAWDHPFRALPPGGTPRIAGGDTLIIGAGSYMMGYGAPGADNCNAGGSFDCHMPPIPSGPSPANPTRILGDSQNLPELWGTERPWFIINLTDASNIEIGYLEITDHSGCVEFHTGGLACERNTPPFGAWAAYGLYAEDSANVYLHHLNIHGLADGGVHAGRLTNWTVEDVRIAGNGWIGWDGDLWDGFGDSNSGTLTFRRWTVEWNGCGETYPGEQPTGCWAQSAGGYGDGFATGTSGGRWIVEDSIIRYNTSDGLDFLYVSEPGSSIEIRRTIVQGNAGNQIKNYRGPFLIENSIIVGNCGFFEGQPFTYNVDNCRALGTALALGLAPGDQITVINNTLTSEGDCLVTAEAYGTPNGSERVRLRNNIFVGQTDFLQPFENTCLIYQETFPTDPFDVDYSVITNVKGNLCPGPNNLCGVSPGLVSTTVDAFDAHLLSNSPAIDAGTTSGAPTNDFDGRPRDANPDIGAYEFTTATAAAFRVSRNGNVYASGAFSSGGADVAERVLISEEVEPGDVLEIDPEHPGYYRKARGPYSKLVSGVVSSAPGLVLGAVQTERRVLLTLQGTILVKATTENGPIRPGDLLTTSSTTGYAMRCLDLQRCDGSLIGKALGSLDAGTGVVLMLVVH